MKEEQVAWDPYVVVVDVAGVVVVVVVVLVNFSVTTLAGMMVLPSVLSKVYACRLLTGLPVLLLARRSIR